MLVHREHVAKAAVVGPLLIDCRTARRLTDKLHHIQTSARDMGLGGGEERKLPRRGLIATYQSSPNATYDVKQVGAGRRE